MKKLLTTFLLVVYFTVSTGFVVSIHYCMDKFSSAEVGQSSDDACDGCGMESESNCCWDDVKVVKLQFQHTFSVIANAQFLTPVAPLPTHSFLVIPSIQNNPPSKFLIAHSPPINEQEKYLLNCVFRI